MKKTIVKLFIFLLPVLLVWASLEYFYRTVPNNYTVKYEQMEKRAPQIEVVLFGSSHCLFGLNPDYFSKNTYNLSNISQMLYFDKLLFDKYFDRLPKLKQVVFCIEYTNLSHKAGTDEDTYRKYYYKNYMHLDVPLVAALDPKNYSLAFTRNLEQTWDILKVYDVRGSILDCKENGWGFSALKSLSHSPSIDAKAKAKAHEDGSMDFSANKALLEQMIGQCQKRNVEVVLVSMPQTTIYMHYLNRKKLNRIFETCREFEQRHENVRYLNLFEDKRFVDGDFFDSDHLNNVGAVKCSKIVNQFLNEK